ncbi:hypothetical protein [Novosphingobium sp.]|uniref:hypothetical protein n=1 Tax=Novosphingobium sp. TaxID=1874826 RepID=UPI003BAA378F
MMDEFWSRGWAEAHKAALQARESRANDGRPVPTLWDDLRKLVRDVVSPPVRKQAEDACGEAATCQLPACQSAA